VERRPAAAVNTVVIKMKSADKTAKRFTAMAEGAAAEPTALAQMVASGLIEHVKPVFARRLPAAEATASGGSREPWAAAFHTIASAAAPAETGAKRAKGLCVLEVAAGADPRQIVRDLNEQGQEVEYAYIPPVKYPAAKKRAVGGVKKRPAKKKRKKKAARSNDPLLSRQWGHAAVRLFEARALAGFTDADDVLVAVLDTGIDTGHPDLDGVIDDYLNFHSSTEGDEDFEGHGTHVSGIIAAEANNSLGIAGVCKARVMAIKGLPRAGTRWDAQKYYQALGYPLDLAQAQRPRILNMSLGGGYDPGEEDIIEDLLDAGIIVVAAMGNEYLEGNPTSYPAAYEGVIAVGATDEADRRASFSCTGSHIALCAPGENILSTVPTYPSRLADALNYEAWPGTSMATPYVSAAAALLLAKHGSLSPQEAMEYLMESADLVPGQTDWNKNYGAGRLNIM
jgi:subtilisin family serine protease